MLNDAILENSELAGSENRRPASSCPMHALHQQKIVLDADDELFFPLNKRVISQYSTDPSGVTELHLYYGDKEISFDEPELFSFGEHLAQQSQFVAKTAVDWGEGYSWPRVRELLEQLIEEGILHYVDAGDALHRPDNSANPLPPAQTTVARNWFDCETIMRELTGRPLELGYLEMVMPIFRVAHMALDQEGRQVGEANVFPKPLRLDIPTEWHSCPFPGSRYQDEKPMNITALKSMRKHWQQTMAVLLQIREAYLRRFPHALQGWTVGDLERLSSLVLAVPAYLLLRSEQRVENGDLHPVLSSMFRVTDGVRMTMHQMLFIPDSEPALPPDAPMTATELFAYAERNYVFHSEYGVCAGPKAMIWEFLNVLVDGHYDGDVGAVAIDPPVQMALNDLEAALDYGLFGLQVHAVIFSFWPMMARAYEELWKVVDRWPETISPKLVKFRERLRDRVNFTRVSRLGTEELRLSRERVYADMYAQSARGLGKTSIKKTLPQLLMPSSSPQHVEAEQQLLALLKQRFDAGTDANLALEDFSGCLMHYVRQEQALVKAACDIQQHINTLLGRPAPKRPFSGADIDIYYLLQVGAVRLTYLVDELQELLDLSITVTPERIAIAERRTAPVNEFGQHGADESTCDGHGSSRRIP